MSDGKFIRNVTDPTVKCPLCNEYVSVPIRDHLERINLSHTVELIQAHVRSHSMKQTLDYFETSMLNQLTPKILEAGLEKGSGREDDKTMEWLQSHAGEAVRGIDAAIRDMKPSRAPAPEKPDTIKYGCGHESRGLLVLDNNPLSVTAYLEWSESVGIKGDRSQCWDCFCEESSSSTEEGQR